jgi:tetrahydromethanopterin S-methyltransferase subunit A
MDKKELVEKAKGLGIKSAHLMKEETLLLKIEEAEKETLAVSDELPKAPEMVFAGEKVDDFRVQVAKAQEETKVDKGEVKFKYRLKSGKLSLHGKKYRAGDEFECSIVGLDKVFEVEKI